MFLKLTHRLSNTDILNPSDKKPYWRCRSIGCKTRTHVETTSPKPWGKHRRILRNKSLIPNWEDQWHETERGEWCLKKWEFYHSMVMLSSIMCRNIFKKMHKDAGKHNNNLRYFIIHKKSGISSNVLGLMIFKI